MKELNVFDFLKSINKTKINLMESEEDEKVYIPFIINRSLSYFPDTIFAANFMNTNHFLDNKMQFDFFRYLISKRDRFRKWNKNEVTKKDELLKNYFGYSYPKIKEISTLISDNQLKEIEKKLYKGGIKK